MLIIRKQPGTNYLKDFSFCLSVEEFEAVHNPHVQSEIQVFTQEGNLAYTIPSEIYGLLSFYLKNGYDGSKFYVTNFREAVDVEEPVEFTSVQATQAGPNDKGFTYNTSSFSKWKFNPGDEYIFVHANGAKTEMHASREGRSLYSGRLTKLEQNRVGMPKIGEPVEHRIVAIYKKLKQEIAWRTSFRLQFRSSLSSKASIAWAKAPSSKGYSTNSGTTSWCTTTSPRNSRSMPT